MSTYPKIAVVIPTYKAKRHVLCVLRQIGQEVSRIYVVDDACPDKSGDWVSAHCQDARVTVIQHPENQGVGGAVITGYRAAIEDGMDILVKLDSDGQMDPALIPDLVAPILLQEADYTKGNRFYDLDGLRTMPTIRLIGNAILSLMSKLSSGYWNLFDPTNGYTALHADVARRLSFHKISRGYFFESDMLFRLNTLRAVVQDVPMPARYGNETSHLKISRVASEFLFKHTKNFFKRIFYSYYLRGMCVASIELPLGMALLMFGLGHGTYHWSKLAMTGGTAPAGTVMLSALPVITGVQFILAFLNQDVSAIPSKIVHRIQPYVHIQD